MCVRRHAGIVTNAGGVECGVVQHREIRHAVRRRLDVDGIVGRRGIEFRSTRHLARSPLRVRIEEVRRLPDGHAHDPLARLRAPRALGDAREDLAFRAGAGQRDLEFVEPEQRDVTVGVDEPRRDDEASSIHLAGAGDGV